MVGSHDETVECAFQRAAHSPREPGVWFSFSQVLPQLFDRLRANARRPGVCGCESRSRTVVTGIQKKQRTLMISRNNLTPVAVALTVIVTPLALFAANPHYKRGAEVTCSPASSSVTGTTFAGSCTAGAAAGLGNDDLTFGVIATGNAATFCHNKGNPANVVPGQNPAAAQFANLQTIPGSAIKNGNATLPGFSFSFSLNSPTAEEAGCPNDNNWAVTLGGATWTASYVVYQPFPNLIGGLSFGF